MSRLQEAPNFRPTGIQPKGISGADNRVAIIVPHVVAHNADAHTGIPFMPHIAAHMAGALDSAGHDVQVIDCFGLQPHHREISGEFMLLGVPTDWVVSHIRNDAQVIFLYCRTVEDLVSVKHLAVAIRKRFPDVPLCFFENTQTNPPSQPAAPSAAGCGRRPTLAPWTLKATRSMQ